MFDIGWTELMVIGVVALIVVGPKDLPGMFRTLGQFTAKIRRMAREFSRAMEDAADASGVKDAAKELNSLRSMTSPTGLGKKAMGLDDLDDLGDSDTPPAAKPQAGSKPKAGDPALNPASPKPDTATTGAAKTHTAKTDSAASGKALSEDRAADAAKIQDAAAAKAQSRLDLEAQARKATEADAAIAKAKAAPTPHSTKPAETDAT